MRTADIDCLIFVFENDKNCQLSVSDSIEVEELRAHCPVYKDVNFKSTVVLG